MEAANSDAARAKVWELVKDIRAAMLVTRDAEGHMSARPMSAVNREFTDRLWFMTSADSPKLDEIRAVPLVLVAYSEPKDQNYVSVRGTARVVTDRDKIRELWTEAARVWFPKGPEESEIALIEVVVDTAEYWDAPSGAMVYAYGYAKARLTGKPPEIGENRKVTF
ncbi:MAG: pyridoxamine 5'-phosphate oxidase family protein [Beijerinckiaceae bacterium]